MPQCRALELFFLLFLPSLPSLPSFFFSSSCHRGPGSLDHSKLKPTHIAAASHLGLSRGSGRKVRCVFRVAHEGHLMESRSLNSRTTAPVLKIYLKQKSRNRSVVICDSWGTMLWKLEVRSSAKGRETDLRVSAAQRLNQRIAQHLTGPSKELAIGPFALATRLQPP